MRPSSVKRRVRGPGTGPIRKKGAKSRSVVRRKIPSNNYLGDQKTSKLAYNAFHLRKEMRMKSGKKKRKLEKVPWVNNVGAIIRKGRKKREGLDEFIFGLKRTEPYQIVFGLEKLHEEANKLDIAVNYVSQVKEDLEEEISILEEELDRCQRYMEETENFGIIKYDPSDESLTRSLKKTFVGYKRDFRKVKKELGLLKKSPDFIYMVEKQTEVDEYQQELARLKEYYEAMMLNYNFDQLEKENEELEARILEYEKRNGRLSQEVQDLEAMEEVMDQEENEIQALKKQLSNIMRENNQLSQDLRQQENMEDQFSTENMLKEAGDIRESILANLEILGEEKEGNPDLRNIDMIIRDLKKEHSASGVADEEYDMPPVQEENEEYEAEVNVKESSKVSEEKEKEFSKVSEEKEKEKSHDTKSRRSSKSKAKEATEKPSSVDFKHYEHQTDFKDLNTPVEKLDVEEITEKMKKEKKPKGNPQKYLEVQEQKVLRDKFIIYANFSQIDRKKIIDILSDPQEASMEKKVNKLLENSDLDSTLMNTIIQSILENIDELDEEVGPTQKMRYEVSKITDNLLLGEKPVDFNLKKKYIGNLLEVSVTEKEIREIIKKEKLAVSSFDEDEIFVYDIKKIMSLTLDANEVDQESLSFVQACLYKSDYITTVPLLMKAMTGNVEVPQTEEAKEEEFEDNFNDDDLDDMDMNAFNDDFEDEFEDPKPEKKKEEKLDEYGADFGDFDDF